MGERGRDRSWVPGAVVVAAAALIFGGLFLVRLVLVTPPAGLLLSAIGAPLFAGGLAAGAVPRRRARPPDRPGRTGSGNGRRRYRDRP